MPCSIEDSLEVSKVGHLENFYFLTRKHIFMKFTTAVYSQGDQMIWEKSPNFLKSSQNSCQTNHAKLETIFK
jgi:hypothetical protein